MVSGYSRDLEREADEQAVHMMARAGYPPHELARFFRIMRAESPDRGAIETFFWGSHPRLGERIETVDREAAKLVVLGARTDDREYDRRTNALRIANARWDAYLGRWSLAKAQIDRAAALVPDNRRDVWRLWAEGQLHTAASVSARTRGDASGSDQSMRTAAERYARVIELGGPLEQAVAYRDLGHLYYAHREHRGTGCEAAAAFGKYAGMQPAARDADAIRARITEIGCSTAQTVAAAERLPTRSKPPSPPVR
jgi:hypothetical protein